jgi:hypothetical protein
VKKRLRSLKFLEMWDWVFTQDGHLKKGSKVIPRPLVQYLDTEREVRAYGREEWLDVETGYLLPEDAFVQENKTSSCTCGAKYTSLPNLHSSWCDFN